MEVGGDKVCLLGAVAAEMNSRSWPGRRFGFYGRKSVWYDTSPPAKLIGVKQRHAYGWNDKQVTSYSVAYVLRALARGESWTEATRKAPRW